MGAEEGVVYVFYLYFPDCGNLYLVLKRLPLSWALRPRVQTSSAPKRLTRSMSTA